jgi:class 3 adenylate cyclase/tetratricopeptide (TPR) repeat protein
MRFCGHCGAPAAGAAPPAPPAPPPPAETTSVDQDLAAALKGFVSSPVADQLIEAGGKLPEERRLITSLFADVSGFTSLSETLDPEQLIETIDPLISALSGIVGRYEGVVDKYAGDALLALFGAPVSHEDDAERAIHVALEMHAEIERLKHVLPHGEGLALHIGVNSGHAIARVQGSEVRLDYNVLGDAVNLAQRLESAAPLGETYVSEATYRLTRHRFEFESVGELTLKGKREPVPAWRVVGELARVERSRRQLVGRNAEVATLTESLDALADGRGSVVVVAGEPGVGKSRLTAEMADLAEERGVRWIGARCLSYGAALAYWPVTDLLRSHPEVVEAAGEAERPFLARLLGEAAPEVAELEPEAFRRGLHEAIGSALATLAAEQPLLLAVEDVHWADPSSVAVAAELARLCPDHPIVLYLITRPEALPSLRDLMPGARELELRPLDAAAVERFMTALLGGSPPEGLAATMIERTGGNPLFVEELIVSLQETEALARVGDEWTMQAGWDAATLPNTIETVIAARIDLLSRPSASLLQTAAVIGRRMRVELLTAVGAAVAGVHERVDELVDKGFLDTALDPDGAEVVLFHHALILDAAYARLLRRTRREMHLRVAEVGEKLYGVSDSNLDLLARHYYLGGAGEKAVHFLVRAGERDKRLFANDEAILSFSRAVELAPENAGIKLELADLYELVGKYDEALEAYEAVREATSDLRAWRGIAATLRKRGEYPEALATIDQAFAVEELKGEDLTTLWSEQGRTLELAGRVAEAADVLRAGLELAQGRRDAAVGHLRNQLARVLTVQGELDAALEQGLEAKAIFDEDEDLRGLASTMRVLGGTYRSLRRLDEAASALRQGLELAERVGNVEEIGGCLLNLGVVEATRDAKEEALVCFRRAVSEYERTRHGSGRAIAYSNLAYMLTLCEQYDEALEYCRRALDVAEAIGHSRTIAETFDTMAAIAFAQGEYPDAARRAEEAATLHLELGANPSAAAALELAGKASEEAGDAVRADSRRERARTIVPTS